MGAACSNFHRLVRYGVGTIVGLVLASPHCSWERGQDPLGSLYDHIRRHCSWDSRHDPGVPNKPSKRTHLGRRRFLHIRQGTGWGVLRPRVHHLGLLYLRDRGC